MGLDLSALFWLFLESQSHVFFLCADASKSHGTEKSSQQHRGNDPSSFPYLLISEGLILCIFCSLIQAIFFMDSSSTECMGLPQMDSSSIETGF